MKGGVGKTTLTANLGAAMAKLETTKKVLLIDADTQCNLTSHFMDKSADDPDDEEHDAQQAGNPSGTGMSAGQKRKLEKKIELFELFDALRVSTNA